jgi:hypothetical protein
MEAVYENGMNTLYATIHQQPMFGYNMTTKWTRFRQFGWSEYMTDADGGSAICEAAAYKAAKYWSQKP